jgi:hypothetical protein
MARNETIDGLDGNRVWGIVANCLTNKNQGITEFDIVEYPLRGRSVTRPRESSSRDTYGKRYED